MRQSLRIAVVLLVSSTSLAIGQGAPMATAFRANAAEASKKLVAAAQLMPADKYDFKPTPAQMTFAAIIGHLANETDLFCSVVGGAKAPDRSGPAPADRKEALVGRLTQSFAFCDTALAALDDTRLDETFQLFGRSWSRADMETRAISDWADHYSQLAIYLRLNGLLPPTAKQ
jgi:DinB superfamily